jgi:phytoene synthase
MTAPHKAYVRAIVGASGSSFAMAMRLLPRAKREAMHALYAYCRVLDDIADDAIPAAHKEYALGYWRQEVNALYVGRAQHPITQALQEILPHFALPREELMLILDGVRFDAEEEILAPTTDILEYYCRCVAGAVGMACLPIFGDTSANAKEFAVTLGMALQLTNILRDISEDAALGRLYMPLEVLQDADVPITTIADIIHHPRFAGACVLLADRAQQCFTHAEQLYHQADKRALLPAWLMLKTYQHVLHRLQAGHWQQPRARARLPLTIKTKLLLNYSVKLALPSRL